MNIPSLIFRELVGMFVDDEFLAVAILAVVAVAALLAFQFNVPPLLVGGMLLFGCIAVLISSALKASRKN